MEPEIESSERSVPAGRAAQSGLPQSHSSSEPQGLRPADQEQRRTERLAALLSLQSVVKTARFPLRSRRRRIRVRLQPTANRDSSYRDREFAGSFVSRDRPSRLTRVMALTPGVTAPEQSTLPHKTTRHRTFVSQDRRSSSRVLGVFWQTTT